MKREILLPTLALCAVQCLIIALVTHIFPFIAAFLLSLNVQPSDVARYSGLAESLISIGDLVFLPLHLKLVQILPHRLLLVSSLLFCGAISASTGFCTHVWQILILRGLTAAVSLGGFLANISLGEIVKGETSGQAFSMFASATFLGAMLGSTVGGYLAEPHDRVPLIGHIELLRRMPYIAPGLAMGIAALLCSLAVFCLVPETNTRIRKTSDQDPDLSNLQHEAEEELTPGGKMAYWDLAKSGVFRQLGMIDFLNKACFFSALTLMSTAGKLPPNIGGLGLGIPEIGHILFLTPMFTAFSLVFLFGWYSAYISPRVLIMIGSSAWLLPALFFTIASNLVNSDNDKDISGMVCSLWYIGHVVGMTWWAVRSVVTASLFPDSNDRALALGVLEQCGNLGCIVGVTSASRMFAFSSTYPPNRLGRQAVWISFLGLGGLTALFGFIQPRIDEGKTARRPVVLNGRVSEDERASLLPRTEAEEIVPA